MEGKVRIEFLVENLSPELNFEIIKCLAYHYTCFLFS
jgi:hypothetical protein